MKIYFYGSNGSAHGFSNVTHHLCTELAKYHDVTNLAYDDFDNYDMFGDDKSQDITYKRVNLSKYYRIKMKQPDIYCIESLIQYISEHNEFDILILSCDLHIATSLADSVRDAQLFYNFKSIIYVPVDSPSLNPDMPRIISKYDFIVTYNQWSSDVLSAFNPKLQPEVIPLGSDLSELYPYTKDEIIELRKNTNTEGIFTITNVNKNQARKCIDRTIQIFAKFLVKYKIPSHLFLKCKSTDNNISLMSIINAYGISNYISFIENKVDDKTLRELYNMSDVFMTTSSGEGHGLSITEAMQCKTPVLIPLHTSAYDILGDNYKRGWYIECNDTSYIEGSNRYLCDIDNGVEQLKRIYDLQQKTHKHDLDKVDNAYEWCKTRTWQLIVKDKWLSLLDKVPKHREKGVIL